MNNNVAPKVSIIMPAYNTASMIKDCLESVFSQTYSDFEILVVNDGSPDTPELEKALEPYFDRIVYIPQENKRAAGARNTGIKRSRGEYLAFLDSDDTWLPDHLSSQMKLFDEDPSLDMVYANGLRIGNARRHTEFMQVCPSRGAADFEALVVERCQIPISTLVVRKRAILAAGCFDETLQRCDDYDMWLRTAFHGARIGYSQKVQARLNGGRPGSLSVSSVKMLEAYAQILDRAERNLPLSDAQRQLVHARALDVKARCLVEQGKSQLLEGRFAQAKELFAEANRSLHRWKVSLAVLGLSTAPAMTSKLVAAWFRVIDSLSG